MGESLKQTNIRLPEGLWKEWKIRAIEEGITMSDFLERALRQYLDAKKGEGEKGPAMIDSIHTVRRER